MHGPGLGLALAVLLVAGPAILLVAGPAILLVAGPAMAAPAHKSNTLVSGKGTAIEGDVLEVDRKPVHLLGIDAPDRGQMCKTRYGQDYDCFRISRDVLKSLVDGRKVDCIVIPEKDPDGRQLGECRVEGVDLSAAMVTRGWAFVYRDLTANYARGESYAQSHRFGLWGGRIDKPWEFRTRQLREKAR
jgi:endonuclease YncB( thermonuclease family)